MMFRKRRSNDIKSNRDTIQSTNINNNNHNNNIVSGGNNNKLRRTRNYWTRAHLYNYVQYRSNSTTCSNLVLVVALLLFVIALIQVQVLIGNLAWNDNSVSYKYFNNRTELKAAVDEYLNTGCATNKSKCDVIVEKYGWPMNNWLVGNVANMSYLFANSSLLLDENISGWDVSSVTSMDGMFWLAHNFSGYVSWRNTSSVTSMQGMFCDAKNFNGDLSLWDTSSVIDMSYMFTGAESFNGDLSTWNTSSVVNMDYMFAGALSFSRDLLTFDTSSVSSMEGLFLQAYFKGNISTWNTTSVTNMMDMFKESGFDGDVSNWDTSSTSDMTGPFGYWYPSSLVHGSQE